MKKRLLVLGGFLFSLQLVFSQNYFKEEGNQLVKQGKLHSKPFTLKSTQVGEDDSYYYWENNSRHTSELNTLLGATGSADGGFDTLGLYTYKVKEKPANGGYWQRAIQGIPTTDSLTLLSIDFVGLALNPAGSNVTVKLYKDDLTTLLASTVLNVNTTYGYKTATFANPVSHDDSLLVVFEMTTVADSFMIAKSHSQWTGFDFGMAGSPLVYNSTLPFTGDASILATQIGNNDQILGLIQENFDFFVIPKFSYNLKSEFTASSLSLCEGDSVSFTNSGNTSHVKNPILNYIEWAYLANGTEPAYTSFEFGNGGTTVYSATQSSGVVYATANTYNVVANTMLWPWTSQNIVSDPTNFAVEVTTCSASLNDNNLEEIAVYPNPFNDVLNIDVKNNSLITLTDVKGNIIKILSTNNSVSLDLRNLSSGVYMLNLVSDNKSSIHRIIKN